MTEVEVCSTSVSIKEGTHRLREMPSHQVNETLYGFNGCWAAEGIVEGTGADVPVSKVDGTVYVETPMLVRKVSLETFYLTPPVDNNGVL